MDIGRLNIIIIIILLILLIVIIIFSTLGSKDPEG